MSEPGRKDPSLSPRECPDETLGQLGIGAAVEALADRVETPKLEIRTTVELAAVEGRLQARLDGEREVAIFGFLRAAIDNCARHAGASRVVVEVFEREDRGEVTIAVRDDGNGFDPAIEAEGAGLRAMRERVELLGGSIEIRTVLDEGTTVIAVVPSARGVPVAPSDSACR